MQKVNIIIENISGLHARPASDFVKCASSFTSDIKIKKANSDEEYVDAKSILFLITRGYAQGTEIELCADGSDESEAISALCELIKNKFGEE